MIGIHQRPAVAPGLARSSWGIRVMMATSLTCLLAGCAIGTSQGPPEVAGADGKQAANAKHPRA